MSGRPKQIRTNMSPFANRLYALLAEENISDFERKNRLSKSTVQRIYGGAEPTRPTLEAIIRGTGCNPSWLVLGEGEMYDSNFQNAPPTPRKVSEHLTTSDLAALKDQLEKSLDIINKLLAGNG